MSLLMLTRCLACAVALVAGCSSPSQKKPLTLQEMISADPLPLAKGAKWTYNVTVKRFDPAADKETLKTLTWTTEVIDAKEGNGVTAFRVRGWPTALSIAPPALARNAGPYLPAVMGRNLVQAGPLP